MKWSTRDQLLQKMKTVKTWRVREDNNNWTALDIQLNQDGKSYQALTMTQCTLCCRRMSIWEPGTGPTYKGHRPHALYLMHQMLLIPSRKTLLQRESCCWLPNLEMAATIWRLEWFCNIPSLAISCPPIHYRAYWRREKTMNVSPFVLVVWYGKEMSIWTDTPASAEKAIDALTQRRKEVMASIEGRYLQPIC